MLKGPYDVANIARQFQTPGRFVAAEPYGNGHINDTFLACFDQGGVEHRLIHQRINQLVFRQPERVMENIARVTEHQHRRMSAAGIRDADRRALSLVPTREGKTHFVDAGGNTWRTYRFIDQTRSVDFVESPQVAYEAAHAFGEFQSLLTDLPGGRLNETIPDFHHTPKRFKAFQQALEQDVVNRAATARREIDFVLAHEAMTRVLIDQMERGLIPERVTHNDTKINNVMLDSKTHKGMCVIDLDTVMPGLALYDFGDMVRTSTSPSAEDEPDLSKVGMELTLFKALVRGYLESAGSFLTQAERDLLPFSGKLITLEIGIRFLTDYLAGDLYFKVHRPGHNLDRCRTQFKLVDSIEHQESAMQECVRRCGR